MCLTSDAAYRIRDADAIFRIERKDDQKIAQNSKLFYRNYFEFATNHYGSIRGTLWRIVSKYIFFLRMVQSFYRRHLQNTTNNVTGAQEDHDRSRYAAYSVTLNPHCDNVLLLRLLMDAVLRAGKQGYSFIATALPSTPSATASRINH